MDGVLALQIDNALAGFPNIWRRCFAGFLLNIPYSDVEYAKQIVLLLPSSELGILLSRPVQTLQDNHIDILK